MRCERCGGRGARRPSFEPPLGVTRPEPGSGHIPTRRGRPSVLRLIGCCGRLSRMPRRPRDTGPGFHHAWVNATGNWDYFLDELDRLNWVRRLVRTLDRLAWTCVAFCQMSTHVHLLLGVPDESLSIGMRDLNREYSRDFNLRHGRQGSFVRKRFGSRRIDDAVDLLSVYSYVVLNPVVEGVCWRPEEWRWSSYRTTIGMSADFPFVDGRTVIAEAGGTPAALRNAVEGATQARLDKTRPEPGSRRGLWS